MERTHIFMLYEPEQETIKKYVEVDEPQQDYYNDKALEFLLEDEPFYEYPGIILPAYLQFTDDGIDVYSGGKVGKISKSCEEYVRDVFLTFSCDCRVAMGGGMCAYYTDGQIYREFEDYFAMLEISYIS